MPEATLPILKADMKHVVGVSHRNINKIKNETNHEVDIDLRGPVAKYEGKAFQMVNLRSSSKERLVQAMLAITASSHRHRTMAPPVVGASVDQLLPPALQSPPPAFAPDPYSPASPFYTPGSPNPHHQAICFSPPYQPTVDEDIDFDETKQQK